MSDIKKFVPAESTLDQTEQNGNDFSEAEKVETLRQFHIHKLSESHINSLFKHLRKNHQHFWEQVRETYKFRDRFVNLEKNTGSEDEKNIVSQRIRLLSPLISAIMTRPEFKAYLDVMLDQATEAESEKIKKELKGSIKYTPQLVVGGGIHASIYNSEFIHHVPDSPALTVEDSLKLGGQFREYGSSVLSLNSPNIGVNSKQTEGKSNINPNDFGPHAFVELTDFSGKLHADNEMIGMTAAINLYMSSNNLIGTSVEKVVLNPNPEEIGGKYLVSMRDSETGEVEEVGTDYVIVSTGLGESDYGLKTIDNETSFILKREKAGKGLAKVMTSADFLKIVGDRKNRFPLEQFVNKKIVIVGGGHSGLVAAEILSGLAPEYRGSVSTLGSPSKIIIMGAKCANREEFLAQEMPRYAELAALMEEKNQPLDGKDYLIGLMPGCYAEGLRETPDQVGLNLLYRNKKEAQGNLLLDADYIIFTTGFINNAPEIFSSLMPQQKNKNMLDLPLVYTPDGKDPVARSLPGYPDVVFIGAAAQVPIHEASKSRAKAYHLPTNEIAVANTMRNTVQLARWRAEQYREEVANNKKRSNQLEIKNSLRIPSSELQEGSPSGRISIPVSQREQKMEFLPEINYRELFKINFTAEIGSLVGPEDMRDVQFTAQRINGSTIDLILTPPLPQRFIQVLEQIFNKDINKALLCKLTDSRLNRSGKYEFAMTGSDALK